MTTKEEAATFNEFGNAAIRLALKLDTTDPKNSRLAIKLLEVGSMCRKVKAPKPDPQIPLIPEASESPAPKKSGK